MRIVYIDNIQVLPLYNYVFLAIESERFYNNIILHIAIIRLRENRSMYSNNENRRTR